MENTLDIKKRKSRIKSKTITPLLMILPAFIGMFIFVIIPLALAVVRALQNPLTNEFTWGNFEYILTSETFIKSFRNVLIIAGALIVLQTISSFFFAILLTKVPRKLNYAIRLLIYIPNLIAPVLVSIIFSSLINPGGSLFATWFYEAGLPPINFTTDGPWPWIIIILAALWGGFGPTVLMMYAGIISIPKTYYEAANIDGAPKVATLFRITLPAMRNVFVLSLVGQITSGLQMLEIVMFMTGGGPLEETITPALYLFNLFSSPNCANYAIAGSLLVMVIIVGLNSITFSIIKTRGSEDS